MEERKIKEHDPQFYETIRDLVPLMPDFRPLETVKKMKAEEQNNWRLIYQEMQGIGMNEAHMNLLNIISEGNEARLKKYISPNRFVQDFIFSYPGLFWLMVKSSSSETIAPLLIANGIYLEEIKEMPIEYLFHIYDNETAKILRALYPDAINDEEIYRMIENMNEPSDLSSGHFYWLFEGSFDKIKDELNENPFVLQFIASQHDLEILRRFLPLEKEQMVYDFLINCCHEEFLEGVYYLLEHFMFTDDVIMDFISHTGNSKALETFLNKLTTDFNRSDCIDFYIGILRFQDVSFVDLMVNHPRMKHFQDYLIRGLYGIIWNLIRHNNVAILSVIVKKFIDNITDDVNDFLHEAIKLKRKEIIRIFLSYPALEKFIDLSLIEKGQELI